MRRVQGPDFDRVRDDFGRRALFDADNLGPGNLKGSLPACYKALVCGGLQGKNDVDSAHQRCWPGSSGTFRRCKAFPARGRPSRVRSCKL